MKTSKKIIFTIAFVMLVLSVLYIKFGGNKLYRNNITTIAIDLPICFLPQNDTELNDFFNIIKNNNNWELSTNSNKLDGVIAFRTYDFKNQEINKKFGMVNVNSSTDNVKQYHIALIDKKNINDFCKRVEDRGLNKISPLNCKDRSGKLYVINDFVTVPVSDLLIYNDYIGLFVMEASNDEGRKFTKDVVKTLQEEFATTKK